MKKMLTLLLTLTLMLVLMMLPATAEYAEVHNPVPEEIQELFDVPAWENYHVMVNEFGWASWNYSEELEAGIVVMSNGSLNVVCVIEPDKNGNLRITQRNYTMIYGDYAPTIELGYGSTTHEVATPWGEKLMFELYNTNGYHIAVGKFDGVWRVKTVMNYADETLSFVFDDRIGYVDGNDQSESIEYDVSDMKYAYGTYDNRFAAFDIDSFPKTLEEAHSKLTNPPVTPTDFYTPVTVTLRASEKYDVYAAPGRDSYRAANGKAMMSTNDWVQIFGEEDGWLLVQYDISSDQMRFGYIDASALPKGTQVRTLSWYDLPEQTIKYSANVTDDPLCSNSIIHRLNAGDKVTVLSSFGTWYYIETTDNNGKALRGFVPKTCIDLLTWDDLRG